MKARISRGVCCAAVFAFAVSAFGEGTGQQPTGQQPTQPQTQPSARSMADQEVTVTGCVQREADYRRERDKGSGGAAGTGVGVGNEFILTAVSPTPGARSGSEPAAPTGTTGATASAETAYELTGPNEGQLAQHVGRRVEIRGKLKASETAGGRPTGGATAGEPPRGVDVASKDLKLRELEVTSVKEATGTCPASVK